MGINDSGDNMIAEDIPFSGYVYAALCRNSCLKTFCMCKTKMHF